MVVAIPGECYEITSEELAHYIERASDLERLNSLFTVALIDFDICHRILLHDQHLLDLFRIPHDMRTVFCKRQFRTIFQMSEAVVAVYGEPERDSQTESSS